MVTQSRILGPDGQPIQMDDVREPQTSRVAQLRSEWQGHPARGLTPSKLAALLVAAEQGDIIAQYELFEDMEERDGHILAEMTKRRRAVASLPRQILPPPNPTPQEEKATERVREIFESIDELDVALFDLSDAIGKGFACLEFEWGKIDGDWIQKTITHRPQSWFQLYRGYRQEIRLRDSSPDGATLNPFGWAVHTHKARSGYLERANLFRALVWPYLFKNYSVGDLAEFLEIYGIPLRLGKFPPGASDKEKATLLRALVEIGHNAAGIVPNGMQLELHAAAEGDPKAFELMMDWCERTESKVILGATLTTQADRGSNTNALGNVHAEVKRELRDSDALSFAATVTRDILYPIAALNGLAPGGLRRAPRFVFDLSEKKDLKVFAEALPPLVKLGMQIPVDWTHTELGIPKAEDGQAVLQEAAPETPPAAPAAPPTPPRSAPAAATAILAPGDPIREMVQQLDQRVDITPWIEQIRAAAAEATSLEELYARLLALSQNMSLEEYAAALREGLTAAALKGAASIAQTGG